MPMQVLKTLYWYFIWVSFQVSMNTVVSMAFTFGYVKVNWDSCLFSVHISNFFPICMRMFPISCLFVCVSFQLLSSISSTFFRSFLCLRASLTGYTCLVWNCPGELKSIIFRGVISSNPVNWSPMLTDLPVNWSPCQIFHRVHLCPDF